MLVENSDEPYAEEIARCITGAIRRGEKVDTTTKVRELIEQALGFIPEKERKEAVKKACARTFQALRIDVNSEFEVLYAFLDKLPACAGTRRSRGDSDLPFRRGPHGKEIV